MFVTKNTACSYMYIMKTILTSFLTVVAFAVLSNAIMPNIFQYSIMPNLFQCSL